MFKKFVNLIEVLALLATAVFVVLLFANEPADESVSAGPGAADSPGNAAAIDGAAVYGDRCAGCHGADGQGSVGPALAGRMIERFPNVADQLAVVTAGRGSMPSFSSRLSAEEIAAVVEYTRTGL